MGNNSSREVNWSEIASLSKTNSTIQPVTVSASKGIKLSASAKAFNKLQSRILKEYPWLINVYESMLVTDNTLPDCPIVYANDDFERMTLYPKEYIIGRNCRFLQGNFTNKNTVASIRKAVNEGKELEVELLNCRRDGTPFLNNFLMLPVHKNASKKSQVTHFVAIQKDVTLLVNDDTPPSLWCSSKVAMMLDTYIEMPKVATAFLENDIDGMKLFSISKADLIDMQLVSRERKAVLSWIKKLKNGKLEQEASNYSCNKNEIGIVVDPDLSEPSQLQFWNKSSSGDRVAIKCYWNPAKRGVDVGYTFDDLYTGPTKKSAPSTIGISSEAMLHRIQIFTVPSGITLNKLLMKVEQVYGFPMKVMYQDVQGDIISLTNTSELHTLTKKNTGKTIELVVEADMEQMNISKQLLYNMPCLLVNKRARVIATGALPTPLITANNKILSAKLYRVLQNNELKSICKAKHNNTKDPLRNLIGRSFVCTIDTELKNNNLLAEKSETSTTTTTTTCVDENELGLRLEVEEEYSNGDDGEDSGDEDDVNDDNNNDDNNGAAEDDNDDECSNKLLATITSTFEDTYVVTLTSLDASVISALVDATNK